MIVRHDDYLEEILSMRCIAGTQTVDLQLEAFSAARRP